LNKTAVAKSTIQENTQRRLIEEIQADGSQPFQLNRTRSLQHSIFNLVGLFKLANIAE
jgi:hypothetical protein